MEKSENRSVPAPAVPPRMFPASLPLIIKQTFSRLHVRDFAHAGPFRARCHDESSKILFRNAPRAQDYDCFRAPSPRFPELDSSTGIVKMYPFSAPVASVIARTSLFHETLSDAGKSTSEDFHIRFACMKRKNMQKTSAMYLFVNFGPLSHRGIPVGNYISCLAKRFCKVLDYANLIRWTRIREERGRAEKKSLHPLNLSSSFSSRGGGCRKLLVGILRRFAAIKTQEGGGGGRIRRGARARGSERSERGCRLARVTNGSE